MRGVGYIATLSLLAMLGCTSESHTPEKPDFTKLHTLAKLMADNVRQIGGLNEYREDLFAFNAEYTRLRQAGTDPELLKPWQDCQRRVNGIEPDYAHLLDIVTRENEAQVRAELEKVGKIMQDYVATLKPQ